MVIYKQSTTMPWNLDKLLFVYPPDVFTGTFQNPMMEARNKTLLQKKTRELLDTLDKCEDSYGAMLALHKNDQVQFLLNNIGLFKKDSCYEKAVLKLYYRKNTSFVVFGDYTTWKLLFEQCDRDILIKSGPTFPHKNITSFRGSSTGNRIGLSWTINRDEVQWFLKRWQDKSLGGGSIFALDISEDDIIYYLNEKHRREVIIRPEVAEGGNIREITSI